MLRGFDPLNLVRKVPRVGKYTTRNSFSIKGEIPDLMRAKQSLNKGRLST